MDAIEFHDVSFSYGRISVLDRVSFSIKKGEYVGIIGPNGGGKTTLLKIILGLMKPTRGKVFVSDRSSIGYVPQRITQPEWHFPATVEEIVASGARKQRGKGAAFAQAVELMGIGHSLQRLISDLSGGERQRVFIARALAGKPSLLVLDEPYVGIDLSGQERFYARIDELNKTLGITILFVSHDIDMVAKTATRCLCINRRLVSHGSPREIMDPGSLQKLYGQKLAFVPHGH